MAKKQWIGIAGLLIVAIGVVKYFSSHTPEVVEAPKATPIAAVKPPEDPCLKPAYETVQVDMADGSMKGLIESGQKYTVTKGWYTCNPVKRGEVVHYSFNSNRPPVPRLVHAIPGDKFKLVKDSERKAWNLFVNGKVVNDLDTKEPHFFGNDAPSVLALYEKSMNGVLAPSTFIVFTTVSPGGFDSGMGVVNVQDFKGRVELSAKAKENAEDVVDSTEVVEPKHKEVKAHKNKSGKASKGKAKRSSGHQAEGEKPAHNPPESHHD